MINAEQLKLARLAILRAVRSGRGRCDLPTMRVMLQTSGFRTYTEDELADDMVQYLVDKGMIVIRDQQISPEVRNYRITAAGQDYLAEEGYRE